MSETTDPDGIYSPTPPNSFVHRVDKNPSIISRVEYEDKKKFRASVGTVNTVNTVQTNDSRDTERMEPSRPNIGLSEEQRALATPSIMEEAYDATENGQRNRNELEGGPLPFLVAKQVNLKVRQDNSKHIMRGIEEENRNNNKKKNSFCCICLIIFIVLVIGAIITVTLVVFILPEESNQEESLANPTLSPIVPEPTLSPTVPEPTATPTTSPTLGPFKSTNLDEIEEVCQAFLARNDLVVETAGEDFQFSVCIDDVQIVLCNGLAATGFNTIVVSCDSNFADADICPCALGEFIDMRGGDFDERDVCVEDDVEENPFCENLLENDPLVDLRQLLEDDNLE